jgi:hypothetical protein
MDLYAYETNGYVLARMMEEYPYYNGLKNSRQIL